MESGDVRGFVENKFLDTDKKEKKKAEKSLLTQATAAASALKNTKEVISLFPTTKTAADQNDDIDNIISNKISATGEDQFVTAQEVVKPAENAACYYTLTSVKIWCSKRGTENFDCSVCKSVYWKSLRMGWNKLNKRCRLFWICTEHLCSVWLYTAASCRRSGSVWYKDSSRRSAAG